jgi:hypothetical protein
MAGFRALLQAMHYQIAAKLTISSFHRSGIPRMPVTAANSFHAA